MYFRGLLFFLNCAQLVILAVFSHKLIVGALFGKSVVGNNGNFVSIFDCGKAVCNYESSTAFCQLVKGMLDFDFGSSVQGRGCFVQNEDWWIFEKTAGNRNSLLLSTAKLNSAFTNN